MSWRAGNPMESCAVGSASLPHPDLAEQGRRYSEQVRGGVVLSTRNLADFIDNLVEQLEIAREALAFYADEKTYTQPTSWGGRIIDQDGPWLSDTGRRAREALGLSVASSSAENEVASPDEGVRPGDSFPHKTLYRYDVKFMDGEDWVGVADHKSLIARYNDLVEQLEAAHASLALADVLIDNARVPDEEWGAMHVEYLNSRAALNPATKFHAYCKDGSLQPCEDCRGSCGIEEAEERASSPASSPDLAKIAEGFVGPQSRKESAPAGEPMGTEAAGRNAAAAGADALARAERFQERDPAKTRIPWGPEHPSYDEMGQ